MNSFKLSVMLLTIPGRITFLQKIIAELDRQAKGYPVEILYFGDNFSNSVGGKRNKLKSLAQGEYSCWIDDDDWVERSYIKDIMKGIEDKPDVVTFNDKVFMNNTTTPHHAVHRCVFKLEHKKRIQDKKNKVYYYLPCHIHPIKHSIVMNYDFPDETYTGADFNWSEKIQKDLKTEHHIDKELYHHRVNITADKKGTNN